jgi:hypothetical protein
MRVFAPKHLVPICSSSEEEALSQCHFMPL